MLNIRRPATETVEHLKASGKYDLGLEDIKAKSVKIKLEPQLIHRDQITGAETLLYELETIVATTPALFDDLERKEAYFYRKLGSEAQEYVAARASLIHTDPETGLSFQTYAVSRPSGRNQFYTDENELASRYRLVPKSKAKDWRDGEVEKIPPFLNKTVFLLSGALIPVWRQIKNVKDAAFKIVRTTTDEGVRLVGLQVPKTTVKEITRLFDCAWRQAETSSEIFQSIIGGTVFLDEVGELSLSLQAKLLKAVEEKRIRRVGASAEIQTDLRIIAATSRNLREMTTRNEFRADLFDRLNVLSLDTISLREQKEKIRELVIAGLECERIALGRKNNFQIEPLAFALLEDYSWTGNFRELQNARLKIGD